nr:unnamed protein product [Spirometra erinaceieuropaei]
MPDNGSTLSFKLLPFTASDPRVWFRQIDAVFSTNRIINERTQYSYVVRSLPFNVAVDVEGLANPIPAEEPYTRLKYAVVQHVPKSENRTLWDMFTQMEPGDQTPGGGVHPRKAGSSHPLPLISDLSYSIMTLGTGGEE